MGKKTKNNKNRKFHSVLVVTPVVCLIMIALAGIVLWHDMARYEDGIMDVCALQQDAYVQLVIDQINLKENRTNEEIITNILETMDASSNKYWTFSSKQSMLFVKDVLETNRYKGFTTATYYSSDSAKEFLDSLVMGRVIHSEIELADKDYMASGSIFEYGGEEYRLCLLTNKDVLLDNNRFLGPKIEMITLISILIIALVVTSCGFAIRVNSLKNRVYSGEAEIKELNNSVYHLNDILSKRTVYDPKEGVWSEATLPKFIDNLVGRGVKNAFYVSVGSEDAARIREILEMEKLIATDTVVKFIKDSFNVGLLFVDYTEEQMTQSLINMLGGDVDVVVKVSKLEDGVLKEVEQLSNRVQMSSLNA